MSLLNTVKDKRERVGRMLQMHSNSREDIKEAFAGDIVAIAGLKETTTGDTLCDPLKPVILERMEFPEPVIEIAIEPKTKGDQEKMGLALNRLAAEDPSFRVKTDEESGQTIIAGMGELHLDILVDRMKREFKVEANIGRRRWPTAKRSPRPPKWTTPTRSSRVVRVSSPASRSPSSRAKKHEVTLSKAPIVGGNVPKEYIPGVEKGIESRSCHSGPIAGFPMLDVKATLTDGAYHDVDSSVLAFEIAGRAAFREGVQKAGPKLLEPVMKVEVVTPEDYAWVGHRRSELPPRPDPGHRNARHCHGDQRHVPLANMFGYVNTACVP
jgi:elongation factor G